jgi:hypothetical protein
MTATIDRPAAFAIEMARTPDVRSIASGCLILRPSEDGWSLIDAHSKVVFRALGIEGRRRCLEFARGLGVLAVLS